jgi:hypothetical protein
MNFRINVPEFAYGVEQKALKILRPDSACVCEWLAWFVQRFYKPLQSRV